MQTREIITKEFEKENYYRGNDLGCTREKGNTRFRVWAPTAEKVGLQLYKQGNGDNLIKRTEMKRDVNGTWVYETQECLDDLYYTYIVTAGGKTQEAVDPYAKSTGVNGNRGMVINLEKTNPVDWDRDEKPQLLHATDSIIYELHIRDFSVDSDSGIVNQGKFLAFTEEGTKNKQGLPTGIDHLKELGITHLHLLPIFDYCSVDEEKTNSSQFNWGYDPKNYNVPEGSYATDPYDGAVRIKECKQAIQSLHKNGIRVVMDVVYNHTAQTEDSNFNKIVPNYYYRKKGNVFSNASACGNETASERSMVRKYIVESVAYWAKEYHIDGFRFDLMGIHDIATMNAIREELDRIDKSILLYGEGWTGGASLLPKELSAIKENMAKMHGVAAFSDDIRDGVKGHVFEEKERGFVSGKRGVEEQIQFGIAGAVSHRQISYREGWADSPAQAINYVSAHDNLTLWDKLAVSNKQDNVNVRKKMNKLAAAIILTSQGIPFFQAGEELLRSKPSVEKGKEFDENSYCSPDIVNCIKWNLKTENRDMFQYYQGLIALRKKYAAFRMKTAREVQEKLVFLEMEKNVIGYQINGEEQETQILVFFNANKKTIRGKLPAGTWNVCVNGEKAGTEILETITEGEIAVPPISAMILMKY